MSVGGGKILRGLPDKKCIVYKNFAQLKVDVLLDYGEDFRAFQGGGLRPQPRLLRLCTQSEKSHTL